jgi:type III pantothenate kinase
MTGQGLLVAIDVSNTTTSLALWRDSAPVVHWVVASDPWRTPDELRLLLGGLLERDGIDTTAVTAAVMACVVPELLAPLSDACGALFSVEPLVVGPGTRTGIAIRTDDPREVGPDRIANAVAAVARLGAPAIVIDCATALTLDVVGSAGDYLGAVIAPGMETAANALTENAARLPRVELSAPVRAIADDTVGALQSGVVLGYLGLVDGLVRRLRDEIGAAPAIATGEAAWGAMIAERSDTIDAYEPLLTLDGLRRIHLMATTGIEQDGSRRR